MKSLQFTVMYLIPVPVACVFLIQHQLIDVDLMFLFCCFE